MKIGKVIELLIADPLLEIDEDDIHSITFTDDLLSIKGKCKNPLKGTSLSLDILYTEEDVDQIIAKGKKNGEYDKTFDYTSLSIEPGSQQDVTNIAKEVKNGDIKTEG